eukprot:s4468_g6.t1
MELLELVEACQNITERHTQSTLSSSVDIFHLFTPFADCLCGSAVPEAFEVEASHVSECLAGAIGSFKRKARLSTGRSQESDSDRQLFSKASSIQQAFVDHVEAGRLERVEDMLEFHSDEFDLNFQDPVHGRTPLMLAALAGSLELVEVLLEARADPHIRERTEMRYTPLEAAQVIMEDEDGDFEEIVQVLAKASGYDRPPPRRCDPGYDFR